MSNPSTCRICSHALTHVLIDLGVAPLANSYVSAHRLNEMEPFYPLRVFVCGECLLVQLEEFESPANIFSEYAYFSSFSTEWLNHSRRYADMAVERFHLGPSSKVVEIASNDGYLLQFFQARGIPVLGIEPAVNVAATALDRGIPTQAIFFGAATSSGLAVAGHSADLLIANNVLAHVPDLHSFVAGMKTLLRPEGAITIEFPHLLQMLRHRQFDTIYHEHFSYFSLLTVERVLTGHGLAAFDVEELPTHGGSLRIYAKHVEDSTKEIGERVIALRKKERGEHLHNIDGYRGFGEDVVRVKLDLLEFLILARKQGKQVAAYGAPAKGNTLLNYCGVGPELLPYTVDRNPRKQGSFLPGCRIPVLSPDHIAETKPDYVLILPWNLRDEVSRQMAHIREWGGRFVVPIPELEVF
jgi:SAM-dependent methyltransferase